MMIVVVLVMLMTMMNIVMHTSVRACIHACMHTYIHTYIHTCYSNPSKFLGPQRPHTFMYKASPHVLPGFWGWAGLRCRFLARSPHAVETEPMFRCSAPSM